MMFLHCLEIGSSGVMNLHAKADVGLIPERRYPAEGSDNPFLLYSCRGQRSLAGASQSMGLQSRTQLSD